MRAIAKSAKIHPAAKKCCGWEKPAICYIYIRTCVTETYGRVFPAATFFAAGCIFADFAITLNFYPEIKTL